MQAYWRRNAHTLAFGNVLTNIGWNASFAFLPLVVREMGVGDNLERWVGAMAFGYFATSCLFSPVWGVLADHYGRKSMVLRAGLGMGTGFIALSFITEPLAFLLVMMIAGLANGYVPAGQALVATNTPHNHVGGALAFTQIGAFIGNVLGPLVAVALLDVLPHYRNLYTFAGMTCLLAGILVLVLVREAHVMPTHRLRIEMRADMRRLGAVPELKLLYYIALVFASTVFGATAIVTLLTMQMLEVMPGFGGLKMETWVAITVMGFTTASVFALPVWGRLLNHHDPGRLLRIQLAGGFVASLLMPLVRDPLELTLARVLLALFLAGMPPTLIRMVRDRAPKGMDARTLSYATAIQQLGNGAAPLVAGLMAPYLGLRAYFWLASAMLFVGLALWSRSVRRVHHRSGSMKG